MLSRFVRVQLLIFTIASIIGVLVMVFAYMQVPTLLGVGKITVTLELPASGGLYRFSNVTYRGVEVGKVIAMDVSRSEATATLRLNTSPKIPADLTADVRSVSAVGEQYVDLLPRTHSPPYLHDGSVISMQDTKIPQQVGPMLDQVSTLLNTIPKDKVSGLVDESFNAVNGSGYDLGSLIDSSSKIAADLNGVGDHTPRLVEDSGPLLDSQAQTTDALRLWAQSLAGITGQVVTNDSQVRTLLQQGPDAVHEVSRLFNQIKPTLPILSVSSRAAGCVESVCMPQTSIARGGRESTSGADSGSDDERQRTRRLTRQPRRTRGATTTSSAVWLIGGHRCLNSRPRCHCDRGCVAPMLSV